MSTKLLSLIVKNLFRSKTRLLATTGCCLVSALIVGFFLTAEHSFSRVGSSAGDGLNLVMTQKDRY